MSFASGHDVTVARTDEELERVRATWDAARWPRLDPEPDYYLTVVRSRPEVVSPYVLVRRDAADGDTIFVARLEEIRLATSIGYRVVTRPSVRAITLVPGGVSGAEDADRAGSVIRELRSALARREADVAVLPALRTDSAIFAAASGQPSFATRQHHLERTTHWALRLPCSFDEFVRSRSKKTRENVRVYRNRLLRDHADDVSIRVLRDPADADTLFRDVETIAAKTYQHGLGVAFADTEEYRALTRLGLKRGWFRAYVLYVQGKPVAFWPGSAWNRTFFVGTPGYDPAFADYSIGTYLLMRVIEDLCADDGIDVLDYGFGEADYKRRFGNESWEEADVIIYAPTLRAARINLTRTGISAGVRVAKSALDRTGGTAKLKRRWRRRLGPARES